MVRWQRVGWGAAVLVAALPAVVGAGAPIPPARAAELSNLLLQDCGSCHGLTRKGGLGSPLTPEALGGQTREGVAAIILDGVPGTAMPSWRPLLTEAEALWLADALLAQKED